MVMHLRQTADMVFFGTKIFKMLTTKMMQIKTNMRFISYNIQNGKEKLWHGCGQRKCLSTSGENISLYVHCGNQCGI